MSLFKNATLQCEVHGRFSAKSALGIYFFAKNSAYPMIIISLALTYYTYLSPVAKLIMRFQYSEPKLDVLDF